MTDEIQDKDVLLVFQEMPNTTRYKASRISWGVIKALIMQLLVPGPKGDKGDTGSQGPQGVQGFTGSPGPRGLPGKDGVDGLTGATGPKGDTGNQGIQGLKGNTGDKGVDGNPKRIERYTALTNASGISTYIFSPAFTSVLSIQIVHTWNGEQLIGGGVLTQSTTGCTVQGMVSRGTLLLTTGPFTKATTGVSVTIEVMGT